MKKRFLTLLVGCLLIGCMSAYAQDTLFVYSCNYNGTELTPDRYPCTYLVETSANIHAAGQRIFKGEEQQTRDVESNGGHYDFYVYANASSDGRRAVMSKAIPQGDVTDPVMIYRINGYTFLVYHWTEYFAKVKDATRQSLLSMGEAPADLTDDKLSTTIYNIVTQKTIIK